MTNLPMIKLHSVQTTPPAKPPNQILPLLSAMRHLLDRVENRALGQDARSVHQISGNRSPGVTLENCMGPSVRRKRGPQDDNVRKRIRRLDELAKGIAGSVTKSRNFHRKIRAQCGGQGKSKRKDSEGT